MKADEIRAQIVNDGPYNGFRPDNVAEQIAVAQLEMLNEIAAQLGEANELVRLRLALDYQRTTERLPSNLCAEIDTATRSEIREELEAL